MKYLMCGPGFPQRVCLNSYHTFYCNLAVFFTNNPTPPHPILMNEYNELVCKPVRPVCCTLAVVHSAPHPPPPPLQISQHFPYLSLLLFPLPL